MRAQTWRSVIVVVPFGLMAIVVLIWIWSIQAQPLANIMGVLFTALGVAVPLFLQLNSQSPKNDDSSKPSDGQEASPARVSRRSLLIAIGVGLAFMAGGSIIPLFFRQKPSLSTAPTPTPDPTTSPGFPSPATIYTFTGHQSVGTVFGLAWSLDGTRVASGASDRTVQVWGAMNGEDP